MLLKRIVYCVIVVFSLSFVACVDDGLNNLPSITVSKDTVLFDTVFTQMGSATRRFMIRNNTTQTINLSRVYIPSLNSSNFRFNVNGYVGPDVKDVEIEGKDSLYVFVEVTLDPNGGVTPLIVEDSIVIEYEGKNVKSDLIAFGQDANYIYPTDTLFFSDGSILPYSYITCNTTWTSTKPYVIVGWAVIDSTCSLTINQGTQVHMYSNSSLWAYTGSTIRVLGEANNPVVFQGTRLEYQFRNRPGQWDRILINQGSTNNIIRHAVIKNGAIGLQLTDSRGLSTGDFTSPKFVSLENVEIRNMSALGIFSRGYNFSAYNMLVTNCGQYATAITAGGVVRIHHSTIANYWNSSTRNFPAMFFSNYFLLSTLSTHDLDLEVNNSIVYGSTLSELEFDSVNTALFKYKISNSLIRIDTDIPTTNAARWVNIVKNQDPKFTSTFDGDFTLKTGSPAINIGDAVLVNTFIGKLLFDLNNRNRLETSNPDAGAYEK